MTSVSATLEHSTLSVGGVYKRFGGVRALLGADLLVSRSGVIHGLIGENGSGKSTLLGVLSGQLQPDAGEIRIGGRAVSFRTPVDAIKAGIAMVSQETALAPDLSVAENILLGRTVRRGVRGIDWRATESAAADVLDRLGLDYDPSILVSQLRPDQRQMVEIARALSIRSRVLILDEPTSSLTDDETTALFASLRQLSGEGVSTILVSHRINDLMTMSDEVTVLRDGRSVARGEIGEFTPASLVQAMIGAARPYLQTAPGGPRADSLTHSSPPNVLEVSRVSVLNTGVSDINLSIREGEIVGLAGLVGAGRSELLEAIFGIRPLSGGTVAVGGQVLRGRGPREAIAKGVGFLPPDRKGAGVVLTMSVASNLTMASTLDRSRLGRPNGKDNLAAVDKLIRSLRIRTNSPGAPVATLSGGNQQKVALGKWLARQPRVLLLDEPTRGVDVAAKEEIQRILRQCADEGLALLISSSENSELLGICNRILVLFRGKVAGSLTSDQATEGELARLGGGHL